jgi:hypothetical protein
LSQWVSAHCYFVSFDVRLYVKISAIGLFWFAFTGPAQVESIWPSIIALALAMCGMVLIFECGIIYLIDSESQTLKRVADVFSVSVFRKFRHCCEYPHAVHCWRHFPIVHTCDDPSAGLLCGFCLLERGLASVADIYSPHGR